MSEPRLRRPRITLKLATSLDGKIALANGASEWITGEMSRAQGRRLRARHDAIAVGANTAHLDNPQLTTRIAGQPDPQRVIFDSSARLSPQSNLALTARDIPVLLFCGNDVDTNAHALAKLGVFLLPIPNVETGLDIAQAMDVLRNRGIESLLVEGGGTLAASFIARGMIDVIEWFRAPIILGGDGRNGIGDLGLEVLGDVRRWSRVDFQILGDDTYERFERTG
ncbi:MAG: RibD family protein [Maricaulaceae bacterium]